jgi:hypothetical protein
MNAFPMHFPEGEAYSDGMTLRDYFAAKALQGLLSNMEFDAIDTLHTASTAYAFADEMLKERSK